MAFRREKWKGYGPTLFLIIIDFALLTKVHGSCGPLPKLVYAAPVAVLDQTNFTEGTQVKYNCRPGYSRSSSKTTLTCIENSWYPITPFCVKKRCHHPGELSNGRIIINTDLDFGSKIEFSCLDGYILIGSPRSVCEIYESGVTWSEPLPTCEIVNCPPPPHIDNGKHSNKEDNVYSFGSSVTYRCNPPFSLVGEASISCTVENGSIGTWSPPPPICKMVSCEQPHFPNGKLASGLGAKYTYKDTVLLECNRGYILNGTNVIHCGDDNQWHPALPTCMINACTKRPSIENAELRLRHRDENVFSVGTELIFTCKYGYKAISDIPLKATCQEDFTWRLSEGLCKKICCQTPLMVNGRIVQLINDCKYGLNSKIRDYCGHQKISTCQADGTWKPEIHVCDNEEISGCPEPNVFANGIYRTVNGLISYSLIFSCNDGYVLIGEKEITCRFSKWSHPFPHCQALCPKPEVLNGKLSSEKIQYLGNERINVQCSPGYYLVGPQYITCSENRSWVPEVPKCEWEFPGGCEKVSAGYKLMQCFSNAQDVKTALEIYKLSLEIEMLELEIDKKRCTNPQSSPPPPPPQYSDKIERDHHSHHYD
ncbi:C4b-binding protein alpha chain [Macrotis lagotis]|uniref:C4b-binding protein alpha chain n=1 Tax=Macrotis lagotis TaxID=92651 RepID=UPI003D69270C